MSIDNYKKQGYKTFKKAPKGGETSQSSSQGDPKFAHIEPVQAEPLEVRVYGNNFERSMRTFRSMVQKERVLSNYKENQSFEKPSDKKRRKRNEMRRKLIELENSEDRPKYVKRKYRDIPQNQE